MMYLVKFKTSQTPYLMTGNYSNIQIPLGFKLYRIKLFIIDGKLVFFPYTNFMLQKKIFPLCTSPRVAIFAIACLDECGPA